MLATKEEKISCILAKHEKLIRESRLSLLRFTIYTMPYILPCRFP